MIWHLPVEDLLPLCAAFSRSKTINKVERVEQNILVLKDVESGLEKAG